MGGGGRRLPAPRRPGGGFAARDSGGFPRSGSGSAGRCGGEVRPDPRTLHGRGSCRIPGTPRRSGRRAAHPPRTVRPGGAGRIPTRRRRSGVGRRRGPPALETPFPGRSPQGDRARSSAGPGAVPAGMERDRFGAQGAAHRGCPPAAGLPGTGFVSGAGTSSPPGSTTNRACSIS